MLLCLVTDRRRLCRADSFAVVRQCLIDQIQHATDAGIDLVQIREGDLTASELRDLVRDAIRISRGSRTRIVVNERLDVALACGADGVHLRGDSVAADLVRRVTPEGFLVGRSVHTVEETQAAGPVDYLIAGTVFESESKAGKAGETLLGASGIAAIVKAASVPVLAIGGVTIERLPAVAAAGAAGVAGIGLFLDRSDSRSPSCRAIPLVALVKHARERFDTPERAF